MSNKLYFCIYLVVCLIRIAFFCKNVDYLSIVTSVDRVDIADITFAQVLL